jgi:putative Mg2+ transporter-C (MgtC) family protein
VSDLCQGLGLAASGPVPVLSPLELGLRVLGAALLGGSVGLERELQNRPAGFRTHILVSLGSCLFTLAGAYGVEPFFATAADGAVSFDPTRVAAQVVTGIGFLGAGAIIRTGASVQGLTTAAALWVTAAIGLAAGLGYWPGAVAITATTVLSLYGLKWVEKGPLRRLGADRHRFVVGARSGLTIADLAGAVERDKGHIEAVHLESDEQGNRRLELLVRLPVSADPARLAEDLAGLDGVSGVDWRR